MVNKNEAVTLKNKVEKVDETEKKAEQHKTTKVKKKKIFPKVIIAVLLFVSVLSLTFSTGFAVLNAGNNKILNGISVNGIDISNLTKEEAILKLTEELESEISNIKVNLKVGEKTETFSAIDFGAVVDIERIIDEAYDLGRTGNVFSKNFKILDLKFNKIDVKYEVTINEEKLEEIVIEMSKEVELIESGYDVDNDELVINPGKKGEEIITEELKKIIIERLTGNSEEVIDVPTKEVYPKTIEIEAIYSEIHKEPKNASFETVDGKFTIYPHEDGLDFKTSLEEVKELLKTPKERYIIPLVVKKPAITTNQIGTENFPYLLGQNSTKYDAGNKARSENLRLAAAKINGTVLLPGQEFSYNNVVGRRTIEAGYQEANIFVNGRVEEGLGGGICQISSTLYNAVLYANLKITNRRPHAFHATYLPAGRDATVVYGSIDFKFVNTRNYPIKIVASVSGGTATLKIYGIREEVEYDVELYVNTLGTTPNTTQYVDVTNLAPGQTKVQQNGLKGYKTQTYRILKKDGIEVSRELLSTDTYKPLTHIINRGVSGGGTTSTEQGENNVVQPPAPIDSENVINITIE